MPRTIFRFQDRQEAALERHLVELRDGKHYTMRTAQGDQPGERAVRLHELLDILHQQFGDVTPDSLVAKLESGEITSADSRLVYDTMVETLRLIIFEPISDETVEMHSAEDMRAVIDKYFLLWQPGTGTPTALIESGQPPPT